MEKRNFIVEGLDKKHVSPRDIIPDSGKKKTESVSAEIKKKNPYPGDPNKKQGYTSDELPAIDRFIREITAAKNAIINKEADKVSLTQE